MNEQSEAARMNGTGQSAGSVWIPTHKATGRIDKLAECVFSKGDIDFEGDLHSDWEWREYALIPVTPNI